MHVIEDFLTAEEEKDLETLLESHASYSSKSFLLVLRNTYVFLAQLRNRTVFHFGYTFDYTNTENSARDPATPIPEQVSALIQRFMQRGLLVPGEEPDQVTVNVYGEPGQGIPSHVDTHSAFEEPILSVSLHSDVVMEFKDCANPTVSTDVLLPRRSLLVMRGEARYRYRHGYVTQKLTVSPNILAFDAASAT